LLLLTITIHSHLGPVYWDKKVKGIIIWLPRIRIVGTVYESYTIRSYTMGNKSHVASLFARTGWLREATHQLQMLHVESVRLGLSSHMYVCSLAACSWLCYLSCHPIDPALDQYSRGTS
jgi:hypothetical protein